MVPPGPRRGEIWYVHTPGQPDDPHQPRPALVVSEDVRNRASDDLLIIPILSAGSLGPTCAALRAGTGGIQHDSVLFCEEITTIDRDFLALGPVGPPLPEPVLRSAIRAVRRALGDVLLQH